MILLNFHITIVFLLTFTYCKPLNAQHPQYLKLNEYLLKYQDINEKGGWPLINKGKVLRAGDVDIRIYTIKKRLIVSGELNAICSLSDTFDLFLEGAVKLFQQNHHIPVNGIVDRLTLHELNIPVTVRTGQIIINMRRWKNCIIISDEPYIYINIGDQKFSLIAGDSTLLQMNVVVGRPTRKTPELNSSVSEIEFNPPWLIPPGIMKKDILPKIKQDPAFIIYNNIKVYLGSKRVDPETIDWDSVDPNDCSYTLIQSPGPKNPMGRIKFSFPNRHYVYMHDTPDTILLNQSIRAYSSGCIRLANAKGLVDYLLKRDKGWSTNVIDSLITSGQNIKIGIDKPVKVLVGYYTVWVNPDGDLQFVRDIYRKDN